VFRKMFINKNANENENGIIKINDTSQEVMDQFLTFLYTERFKPKRREGDEFTWAASSAHLLG